MGNDRWDGTNQVEVADLKVTVSDPNWSVPVNYEIDGLKWDSNKQGYSTPVSSYCNHEQPTDKTWWEYCEFPCFV